MRDTEPGTNNAIPRAIVGFHQDEESHWVAELECGHTQHLRHEPPWQVRSWVITAEGRESRLGTVLPCVLCSAATPPEKVESRK